MNNAEIEAAFETVQKAIKDVDSPTEEGRQTLEALAQNMSTLFSSTPRILHAVPESCIEYFLNAEFDAVSPGNRGLGRTTDFVPRLAARHRPIFGRLAPERLAELRKFLKQHILCGYLFLDTSFQEKMY